MKIKKAKSQKAPDGVEVLKAHHTAAANIIQSNSREGHPQALLARVLALEEKISGAKPAVLATDAPEKAA